MGRYIFRRKALILAITISVLANLYTHPLKSKNSKVINGDQYYINNTSEPTKNNYKHFKHYSFRVSSIKQIQQQYDKKSKKHWERYLRISYNKLIPFRDFIAKEIITQQVPHELLYLPIIESGVNTTAISHMGATGLWQFMPNSSEAYNMITNNWIDERRDFVKSTKGAISKLKYNYNVTGDWLLAIAAYNCGLGRVLSVQSKTGIDNFWEMADKKLLPQETIDYVPKLILVSYLMQNKTKNSVPIKWETFSWEEIELMGTVDLRLLSKSAGIPLSLLKFANSELNYDITPPININYKLKIPLKYTDSVISALKGKEQDVKLVKYRVKYGDTLSEIGYSNGITVYELKSFNPGVTYKNLKAGQDLTIPLISKSLSKIHVVKSGDTLWGISKKYRTTPRLIAQSNGLNINSYIKKGMRLRIP